MRWERGREKKNSVNKPLSKKKKKEGKLSPLGRRAVSKLLIQECGRKGEKIKRKKEKQGEKKNRGTIEQSAHQPHSREVFLRKEK